MPKTCTIQVALLAPTHVERSRRDWNRFPGFWKDVFDRSCSPKLAIEFLFAEQQRRGPAVGAVVSVVRKRALFDERADFLRR
jgi:hypothetical protein